MCQGGLAGKMDGCVGGVVGYWRGQALGADSKVT